MKKGKKTRRIRIWITAAVTALILLIAFFCYQTVKKTIVNNEKESMAGIARVSAHSLETVSYTHLWCTISLADGKLMA